MRGEPRGEAAQREHCLKEQLRGPALLVGDTAAGGDGDESLQLPLLQREVGKVHGTQSHLVRFGRREGTPSFLQCALLHKLD